MAANLKQIEDQIANLNSEQLKQFRAWYDEFDAENWDSKIELDAQDGKFNDIANEALSEHGKGKSKPL